MPSELEDLRSQNQNLIRIAAQAEHSKQQLIVQHKKELEALQHKLDTSRAASKLWEEDCYRLNRELNALIISMKQSA